MSIQRRVWFTILEVLILIAIPPSLSLDVLSAETTASIVMGQTNIENALFLDQGGDVDTEVALIGAPPVEARRTGSGTSLSTENTVADFYMQFNVDDGLIFEASPTRIVQIEIEYFDEGTDEFRLQYDALGTGGPLGDGRFTEAATIHKTATKTFKTVTVTLYDAYFGNRDNSADFRIDDRSDGPEIIRSVTLTLQPPPDVTRVDASTWDQKVLFGYQGWFQCQGDGSRRNGWVHWSIGLAPMAFNTTVDYWPDVSELQPYERCETAMTLPDGRPAYVYSSARSESTVRHFQWMAEYGIDGVLAQRFVSELQHPDAFEDRNTVLRNIQNGAEIYERVFSVEYDLAGTPADSALAQIKQDWMYLVDQFKVTESEQYLRHDSLPVVGIWGLGFEHIPLMPTQAWEIIDWFHNPPEGESYRAKVIGGVPAYWRTLDRDSRSHLDWAQVYRSFDMIMPWTVGRYVDEPTADNYASTTLVPDLQAATDAEIGYAPVVFPGFSWTNLMRNNDTCDPFNPIPRDGGKFYWRQVFNAIQAGASTIKVAMFDELDEGTAMFKMAPSKATLPAQGQFVPLDVDGYALPSDWYLRLGTETGKMIRDEIDLSDQMPFQLPPSRLIPRGPILIDGDTGFIVPNGVSSGSGTEEEPYVISNWKIDATASALVNAIDIANTTKHFVIRDCILTGASWDAISIINARHVRIENCLILGNGGAGIRITNSVLLDRSETSGYRITDNILAGNRTGIELWQFNGAPEDRIFGNTISCNGEGVVINEPLTHLPGPPLTVTRNEIMGNHSNGVRLERNNAGSIQILENVISGHPDAGVALLDWHFGGEVVKGNLLLDNRIGVQVNRSSRNVIAENTMRYFLSQPEYGIKLEDGSFNQFIYLNNFIGNKINATDGGSEKVQENFWDQFDIGGDLAGNYWSDYPGIDANEDGIGDTPHGIPGGAEDRYPMMQPYWDPITSWIPILIGP